MFDENSNATAATLATAATAMPPNANLNSAHVFNQLLTMKDSRWLQLEVCREFQRGQCSRSDADCKFAHPPAHVDVQNGRVTACYDSIKGRCTRENPKCKYMHPTPQQKEQLLVNGKNNLALKNMICAQLVPQAGIPNNLQLAQLMQQQQQQQPALMPTLPYPFYSPLTAIYPYAGDPYQVQTPSSSMVARQLALLQQQSNTAALSAAATQQSQQSQQNALILQLLQQQQLYGGAATSPQAASLVLQQQLAAVPENRKRSARSAGFEDSADEKKSNVLPPSTNAATNVPSSVISTASIGSPAVSTNADLTAIQNQLLFAAAAATNSANGVANGKRHGDKNGLPTNGIPIYQAAAAQFNPYMMQQVPGFVPVTCESIRCLIVILCF
ncbi:Protein muscleblind [Aphelenchoides besseyi]|nr:Protein muscleblind [Aphelenchoides besseyi]